MTFLSRFARLFFALVLTALVMPPIAAGVAGTTLLRAPLPGDLPERRPNITAVPSIVTDRDGNEIGVFRGFDRTVDFVPSDIPDHLIDAVIAIEDRRFFEHRGVDLEGIARAARTNAELGEIAQGGSTITQQYIKNVYLSGERTFERKFREALLATELEQNLSKDEILFRYLESSYFGSGAYGLGAAAEVYFGKAVSDIDVSEAAMLAGVIQAPTRLSPRVDLKASEARRQLVLEAMLDEGYIDLEEFDRQAARRLWLASSDRTPVGETVTVIVPPQPKGATDHAFFVDWIEQQLLEELGPDALYREGLTIETSIDTDLQEAAERAVAERLQNTEYPVDMSLVSIDPGTGEVLVMVGGRDYDFSEVNLAIGGSTGFQPGSSFKPIVLATAFEQGIGPETIYPAPGRWSVPGCSGSQCTISNYDGSNYGALSLRAATHASVNTVFAELVTDVSITDTITLARELGISRLDPDGVYGASIALGAGETSPLEMASVYGTFANSGTRVEPVSVLRVFDADGNVIVDNRAAIGERVLTAATADNISDILQGVVSEGTGRRAAVGPHPIAGKTGTSQAHRAAWFVGYTPSLSTAVWMGHADGLASLYSVNGVGRVTGGSHPAIAFSDFMSYALADVEPEAFPVPAEIVAAAETSEEVVRTRQEETVVGQRSPVEVLASDCNGPCSVNAVPRPALSPVRITTTTTPPATNGETSTTTPGSTSSTTSAPSSEDS